MSTRWPARTLIPNATIGSLSVGLLCFALVGCQSAALRETSRSSTSTRKLSVRLVSNTVTSSTTAKKPESWQLQKTQREEAVRQTAVDAKSKGSVMQASFESELWQNEQPAQLVSQETSWCAECPLSDSDADCECQELCFGCDFSNAMPTLWNDAKGVVNWNNGLILAAAGGVAIWFREGDIDREVRENAAAHPLRWGHGSQLLGRVGDVRYQAPVLLGLYGYSVWKQDEELHDVMGSLLSASVITGVSTSALKLITNTDRPTDHLMNGHYGFPSYHTSSSFAIAAVLDEYYGSKVGLPAYLLAGAVGFSRIDERDHNLSDVVFGGVLGIVVGKAVAGRHLCGNSKIQFGPYFHPTDGSPGIALETKF